MYYTSACNNPHHKPTPALYPKPPCVVHPGLLHRLVKGNLGTDAVFTIYMIEFLFSLSSRGSGPACNWGARSAARQHHSQPEACNGSLGYIGCSGLSFELPGLGRHVHSSRPAQISCTFTAVFHVAAIEKPCKFSFGAASPVLSKPNVCMSGYAHQLTVPSTLEVRAGRPDPARACEGACGKKKMLKSNCACTGRT